MQGGTNLNRTEEFCRVAKAHRDGLKEIWSTYDKTLASLERYRGSAGYETDKKAAERTRDEAISRLRQTSIEQFDAVLGSMKEKVGGKAAVPPGEAELRLLQTLKLRNQISREEFEAAARALQDNAVALRALDDLAQTHGFRNMFVDLPAWRDTANVHQEHIAQLLQSARQIVRIEKPDSRDEAIRGAIGNHSIATGLAVDRDFETDSEALSCFGGFRGSEDMANFQNAVND